MRYTFEPFIFCRRKTGVHVHFIINLYFASLHIYMFHPRFTVSKAFRTNRVLISFYLRYCRYQDTWSDMLND